MLVLTAASRCGRCRPLALLFARHARRRRGDRGRERAAAGAVKRSLRRAGRLHGRRPTRSRSASARRSRPASRCRASTGSATRGARRWRCGRCRRCCRRARVAAAAARRAGAPARSARACACSLWRDRVAWQRDGLHGASSALQFYSMVAWLPEIYRARGHEQGRARAALLSLSLIGRDADGLRRRRRRAARCATSARSCSSAAVARAAPAGSACCSRRRAAPSLWAILLGLGFGTGFTLVLALFVLRAHDAPHAAALSGMAQSVGYTVAAIGPIAVGALHDLTGELDRRRSSCWSAWPRSTSCSGSAPAAPRYRAAGVGGAGAGARRSIRRAGAGARTRCAAAHCHAMPARLPDGDPAPADGALPAARSPGSARRAVRRLRARAVLRDALRLLRLQHVHAAAS